MLAQEADVVVAAGGGSAVAAVVHGAAEVVEEMYSAGRVGALLVLAFGHGGWGRVLLALFDGNWRLRG